MNQFYYTRKEPIEGTDPVEYAEFTDSINVNKIIRSVQTSSDTIVVLLDDMHNKVIDTKKKGEVFQTEAYLHGEDIVRFKKLTNIE